MLGGQAARRRAGPRPSRSRRAASTARSAARVSGRVTSTLRALDLEHRRAALRSRDHNSGILAGTGHREGRVVALGQPAWSGGEQCRLDRERRQGRPRTARPLGQRDEIVVVGVDHQVPIRDRTRTAQHPTTRVGSVEAVELVDLHVDEQHAVRREILREPAAERLIDLEHRHVGAHAAVEGHLGEDGGCDALRQIRAAGVGEDLEPAEPAGSP